MPTVPLLDLSKAYQELKPELDDAIAQVVSGGWYIGGGPVEHFEQQFADYCGTKACVGVGNGLDALTLILRAYGIGEGDEVIVPAFTFIATWQAVSNCGATPVAMDVAGNGNIDPDKISAAITPNTAAVIVVHLYGQIANVPALKKVCASNKLLLIEDAAQAHGARLDKQRTGSLADAAAFSFYPGKNLGAMGDGGAVVSDDTALVAKIRQIANYGSKQKYQHDIAGCNSRLDTLQAAVLSVKLQHLDDWNSRRTDLAKYYLSELVSLDYLQVLDQCSDASNVWHQFVIRCTQRDRLQDFLQCAGVQSQIHYPIAPPQTPVYKTACESLDFSITESLSNSVLSLPMGPHVSAEQRQYLIQTLHQFDEDKS